MRKSRPQWRHSPFGQEAAKQHPANCTRLARKVEELRGWEPGTNRKSKSSYGLSVEEKLKMPCYPPARQQSQLLVGSTFLGTIIRLRFGTIMKAISDLLIREILPVIAARTTWPTI